MQTADLEDSRLGAVCFMAEEEEGANYQGGTPPLSGGHPSHTVDARLARFNQLRRTADSAALSQRHQAAERALARAEQKLQYLQQRHNRMRDDQRIPDEQTHASLLSKRDDLTRQLKGAKKKMAALKGGQKSPRPRPGCVRTELLTSESSRLRHENEQLEQRLGQFSERRLLLQNLQSSQLQAKKKLRELRDELELLTARSQLREQRKHIWQGNESSSRSKQDTQRENLNFEGQHLVTDKMLKAEVEIQQLRKRLTETQNEVLSSQENLNRVRQGLESFLSCRGLFATDLAPTEVNIVHAFAQGLAGFTTRSLAHEDGLYETIKKITFRLHILEEAVRDAEKEIFLIDRYPKNQRHAHDKSHHVLGASAEHLQALLHDAIETDNSFVMQLMQSVVENADCKINKDDFEKGMLLLGILKHTEPSAVQDLFSFLDRRHTGWIFYDEIDWLLSGGAVLPLNHLSPREEYDRQDRHTKSWAATRLQATARGWMQRLNHERKLRACLCVQSAVRRRLGTGFGVPESCVIFDRRHYDNEFLSAAVEAGLALSREQQTVRKRDFSGVDVAGSMPRRVVAVETDSFMYDSGPRGDVGKGEDQEVCNSAYVGGRSGSSNVRGRVFVDENGREGCQLM